MTLLCLFRIVCSCSRQPSRTRPKTRQSSRRQLGRSSNAKIARNSEMLPTDRPTDRRTKRGVESRARDQKTKQKQGNKGTTQKGNEGMRELNTHFATICVYVQRRYRHRRMEGWTDEGTEGRKVMTKDKAQIPKKTKLSCRWVSRGIQSPSSPALTKMSEPLS